MRRRALFVLALIAVQALPASAAVHIRRAAVGGYPRISVTVSTDDATPLSRGNVAVSENGVAVPVVELTFLGGTTRRVDAVLAVDVSNSMQGPELRTALAAAEAFVLQAPTSIAVGVLAFAEQPSVVTPVSDERGQVVDAVSQMRTTTASGTALFDAVVTASGMFDDPGQHNLVVLTDGRNTTGQADLNGAIAAAGDAGVTVFTIGLEGGDPDESTLRRLANSSGGRFSSITPKDLGAAYERLAVQLGQQYVVTYRSKTPPGTQADVVVVTPGGTARTSLLMPPPVVRSSRASMGLLGNVLQGDLGALVVVGLTFLAAVSLIVLVRSVIRARRHRRELEGRMVATSVTAPAHPENDTAGRWVPRPLASAAEWGAEATRAAGPVAAHLERAGWKIHVGDFLAPALLLPVTAAAAVGLFAGPLYGGLVLLATLPLPFLLLSRAGSKRIDAFQRQLPDVLMVLASSLRAGHSFLQALDSVAKEVDDPAAIEFARALAEIQLGRTVEDALGALSERARSQDLDWAVTAINIQRKVGGNLAEVLETVANTIRGREQVRRQIKVLSAEGRYSVYILTILPFFILGYLALVNPGYLEPLLATPTGIMLLIGGGVLMLIGFVWMRKTVRLDV